MKTSKAAGPTVWQFLASHALTSGLGLVFLVFFVLSRLIVQEPRPFAGGEAPEKVYSPELLYSLRQAGLTDVFRSGWFISLLIVLSLNLICILVARWPLVWGALRQKAPSAVQAAQLVAPKRGGRNEFYLGSEHSTPMAREAFRELVQKWAAKHRLRRPRAIRDEGGLTELQLAIDENRFAPLAGWLAHLAAIGVVVAVLAGTFLGFEGRMIVEEGVPARHLEVLRGADPRWPAWVQDGLVMPGFRNPGFEVQLAQFTGSGPRGSQAQLRFLAQNHAAKIGTVAAGEPVRYRGLNFFYRSDQPTTQPKFSVSVKEAGSAESVRFPSVVSGQTHELDGASFRIIGQNPGSESGTETGLGPSIEVEYREGEAAPERFWVFERHPSFDEVRRKRSRFHFVYEGTEPRMSVTLQVVRDPGVTLAFVSGVAFLLALASWALLAHHRYWFSWKPGKAWLVASSDRLALLEPRFDRITRDLKKLLEGGQ